MVERGAATVRGNNQWEMRMRVAAILAVSGLIVLSMGSADAVAQPATAAAAQNAVRDKLRDPQSARFSDVRPVRASNARGEAVTVVCGRVNARNAQGGMSGARPFVYFPDDRSVYLMEGSDADLALSRVILRRFCPHFIARD